MRIMTERITFTCIHFLISIICTLLEEKENIDLKEGPQIIGEKRKQKFFKKLFGESGGEKQKVMLARALAQQPKVQLLDEPTSALDIQNQYQVLKLVREICHKDQLTAIVVIHDLNLALRFCDRFLLLKDGQVFRYGDRSVLDGEALEQVYGVKGKVVEVEGRHMVLVEE